MKIIGLTLINKQEQGSYAMYLKPDSALVVNGKPFFIPQENGEYYAHLCVVAKINRLGKNIAPKFAYRYYDELTIGLNIINHSQLLIDAQDSWLMATAFDNSMVVGQFSERNMENIEINGVKHTLSQLPTQIEKAISQVSQTVTIRMGDMVAVDLDIEPKLLNKEDVINVVNDNQEILFCRIK